jgi:hypothetical protein
LSIESVSNVKQTILLSEKKNLVFNLLSLAKL